MTIPYATNAAPRRKFGPITTATQPDSFAPQTGLNVASLDLPPALKSWHCRDCGSPVPSDRATCPACTETRPKIRGWITAPEG